VGGDDLSIGKELTCVVELKYAVAQDCPALLVAPPDDYGGFPVGGRVRG
jgi:hypothetical protein